MVCSGVRQPFSDVPSQYRLTGGYNVGIRLDRNSGDYLFGRLARTRFVSGIALAKDPFTGAESLSALLSWIATGEGAQSRGVSFSTSLQGGKTGI